MINSNKNIYIYILPRTFGQNGIWNFIELEISTERWKSKLDHRQATRWDNPNFKISSEIHLTCLSLQDCWDFTSIKLDVFVRIVSPFEAAKCKANQMEEPSTQHSLQTHYVTFKSKYITFSRWKKRYPSTNSSCNQASP